MPTTTIEDPGNSPVMKWIRDHLDYPYEDHCLIWPFTRQGGYGTFVRKGKKHFAHRFICEAKNGPPPTPEHQAAHSCNRGHEACANHHHLRWKTPSENLLESRPRPKLKLLPEQAREIRDIKGLEPVASIAERFSITETTVRDIQNGRTWKPQDKRGRAFRDHEVQYIRSMRGRMCVKELADQYEVSTNVIYNIWRRATWTHVPEASESMG